jgi:hypothetical protein
MHMRLSCDAVLLPRFDQDQNRLRDMVVAFNSTIIWLRKERAMKAKTRITIGLSALALGLAVTFGFGTSPASAQAWANSGYGTGNPLPYSYGANGGPAITPWNNPDNVGNRMNGSYSTDVLPVAPLGGLSNLYNYVPPQAPAKHAKHKAR